jgi:hypothetical protein
MKYTHEVIRTSDGALCSEHRTEAAAIKAAARLQAMSRGKLPAGAFTVRAIVKV